MVAADLYLSDCTETVLRTAEDLAFAACLAVQVSLLREACECICIFVRKMTALFIRSNSFSRYYYRICLNMCANTVTEETVRLISDLKIGRFSIRNMRL